MGAEAVAEMLGCSAKTVLRLAKAREIPSVQVGKLWRFRRSVIDEWLTCRLQFERHPRVAQEEHIQ
ncbi:MAG: helix-turn-helix domain-containing protein [Terriglobales bacterium]